MFKILKWFKRKQITNLLTSGKRKSYTLKEVELMFSNSTESPFENYYGYSDLFFTFSKVGVIISHRTCKEEIVTLVRDCIDKGFFCKVGLQVRGRTLHDLKYKSKKISEELFNIEKQFNFTPHVMEVSTIKYSTSVYNANTHKGHECILIFTLDKKWFTSPVTISFALQSLRNSSKDYDCDYVSESRRLKNTTLFNLLTKHNPSVVFGKSVKLNWGLAGFRGKFESNYGNFLFEYDVKYQNVLRLKKHSPKNKVFSLL